MAAVPDSSAVGSIRIAGITAADTALVPGTSRDISAEVRDLRGVLLPDEAIQWQSSAPAIVSVDPFASQRARLSVHRAGSVVIEARSGAVLASIGAAAKSRAPFTLALDLLTDSPGGGFVQTARAIVRDSLDRDTEIPVDLVSQDTTVAYVVRKRMVVAIGAGETRLVASAVTPAGNLAVERRFRVRDFPVGGPIIYFRDSQPREDAVEVGNRDLNGVTWITTPGAGAHRFVFDAQNPEVTEAVIAPPDTAVLRLFRTAGVYRYHCETHPETRGLINVR